MRIRVERHAALLAVLLLATVADAEPSAHDKAMASQLFDDAERLMASKPTEACPKYGESYHLDPQLGTLLHLGECYAKVGKTAGAWVSFKDALEIALQKGDPRESKVRERLRQLETTMPKLVITVPPTAPADLEVRQDGEVVARVVWGSPVPIDPGVHTISAKAFAKKPWIGNVQIAATATTFEVRIPDLIPETSAPMGAPMPIPQPPPPQSGPTPVPVPVSQPAPAEARPTEGAPPPPAYESHSAPGTTQRVLGWTTLAVGAVGLGVGTVFVLKRSSDLRDRDAICASNVGCTTDEQAQVNSLTDDARSASLIGAIGLIAGGALAVTGVILVLTAPHGASTESVAIAPVAGPGFQGITVAGRL